MKYKETGDSNGVHHSLEQAFVPTKTLITIRAGVLFLRVLVLNQLRYLNLEIF